MSYTLLKPSKRNLGGRIDKVSDKSLGFVPARKVKTQAEVLARAMPKVRRNAVNP